MRGDGFMREKQPRCVTAEPSEGERVELIPEIEKDLEEQDLMDSIPEKSGSPQHSGDAHTSGTALLCAGVSPGAGPWQVF